MVSVRLKVAITHEGRYRRAGHVLLVPSAEAEALLRSGVAEAMDAIETAAIAPPLQNAMRPRGRPRKRLG
jgi:hypothetical protein